MKEHQIIGSLIILFKKSTCQSVPRILNAKEV